MASIQRRSGSWRAVIRRAGHPTLIKTFPTKAAAEFWARRTETVRSSKLIRAPWTAKRVKDVGRPDLIAWKASQTVSGPSVRREMVLMSAIFNHARGVWGLILQNPIKGVPLPADSKARERRPSATELGAIRTHFQEKKMGLLVELAIETAMRLGEMCSLRLGSVHMSERYVQLADKLG